LIIIHWLYPRRCLSSPRPVCILCTEILHTTTTDAAKLKRLFETKHSEHKGGSLRFFSRMLEKLSSKETDTHTKFKSENETALTASV